MSDEIGDYSFGWAFYVGCGVEGGYALPLETDDLTEWIKGFMSAQADYDLEQDDASIEAALIALGVKGAILGDLLSAADVAFNTPGDWFRAPSVSLRSRSIGGAA